MNIPIGTHKKKTVSVDSDYHIAAQGASGVGKSTLLLNLFVEFIRDGGGAMLLDLHGDLAEKAMTLVPLSRRRDVIYVNPAEDRIPPFNPLHFKDPADLQLAQEDLAMILKAFSGDAWGNETPWVIRNSIEAVCKHFKNPTPVHVFRFLVDEEWRDAILNSSTDPFLKLFQKQYEALRKTEQMAKFSPSINKEGKLMHPAVVPIIGQEDSIDLLDAMNTGKIIIVNLSKGRIGEEAAQILASLFAPGVSIAGLKREKQTERRPFMLVVDEAGSAAHSGRFASILEESRKYGISLVLGFQGMYQLYFSKAVRNNCSTKIIYNSSGDEAEETAKDWLYVDPRSGDYLAAENITALPRYEFWCRSFEDNEPKVRKVKAFQSVKRRYERVEHAQTYQRCLECHPESLKRESLQRYSRDKTAAMAGVANVLK